MAEIVMVAGSINTDLVVRTRRAPEAGETVTGSSFEVYGGGKGANQAFAVARSGSRSTMLGAVGNDDFGATQLRGLQTEGIDTTYVDIVDSVASGVALITVEEAGENRIAYVPGATMAVSPERAGSAVADVRPDVVLATLELPAATLQQLFEKGRVVGAVLICNATPEPAKSAALALSADILIVNETEALELVGESGSEHPWPTIAEALRDLGPDIAIITLGKDGVVMASESGIDELAGIEVEVVDTTAAGDAFCGAFATYLAETGNPLMAARAGNVAGSLAVSKEGAQPSIPYREEIESVLAAQSTVAAGP